MSETTSNDNDAATGHGGRHEDAPGQAAILLVEGLIHCLIAKSVISVEEAIEIVASASEVKDDIATDRGETPLVYQAPRTILESIAASLAFDRPPG